MFGINRTALLLIRSLEYHFQICHRHHYSTVQTLRLVFTKQIWFEAGAHDDMWNMFQWNIFAPFPSIISIHYTMLSLNQTKNPLMVSVISGHYYSLKLFLVKINGLMQTNDVHTNMFFVKVPWHWIIVELSWSRALCRFEGNSIKVKFDGIYKINTQRDWVSGNSILFFMCWAIIPNMEELQFFECNRSHWI